MNLVAAVIELKDGKKIKWAIGYKKRLLVRNGYDLKHFQTITMGADKTVVYGRKTLETFPGKKPLKGRNNLVLTHDQNYVIDGATIIHDLSELDRYFKHKTDPKTGEEYVSSENIYVIGGASIYNQLYDKCEYAFITHFESTGKKKADAFIPNLAEDANWEIVEETPAVTYDGVTMRFVTYRNLAFFPKPEEDVD